MLSSLDSSSRKNMTQPVVGRATAAEARITSLKGFGESPFPAFATAALVASRPFYAVKTPRAFFLFPTVFLLSSGLSFQNYKVDAAGITASWSLVYLAMLRRMKASSTGSGVRTLGGRAVAATTIAACVGNVVTGGLVFTLLGDRKKEELERERQKVGKGWAGDV